MVFHLPSWVLPERPHWWLTKRKAFFGLNSSAYPACFGASLWRSTRIRSPLLNLCHQITQTRIKALKCLEDYPLNKEVLYSPVFWKLNNGVREGWRWGVTFTEQNMLWINEVFAFHPASLTDCTCLTFQIKSLYIQQIKRWDLPESSKFSFFLDATSTEVQKENHKDVTQTLGVQTWVSSISPV